MARTWVPGIGGTIGAWWNPDTNQYEDFGNYNGGNDPATQKHKYVTPISSDPILGVGGPAQSGIPAAPPANQPNTYGYTDKEYADLTNYAFNSGQSIDESKLIDLMKAKHYTDPQELINNYVMLYGTPLQRLKLTAGKENPLPTFNTDSDKALMDAWVASLEDPFKTSTNTLLGNMAARGIVGSGIQQEGVGRLASGYNKAVAGEADTITNNTANNMITAAEQNYKTQVDNYLAQMETLFKSSGQTAEEFYAKNQAMIDAQIQKFADQKDVDYLNAQAQHQSNMTDFQNTIDATNALFGSIGTVGGSLLSNKIPLSQAVNQTNSLYGNKYGYNKMLNYPLVSGLDSNNSASSTGPWASELATGGLNK